MKANTVIYVAIRNIGDRADPGQIFTGTLKESIFWLAGELNKVTMADRIVVGIGRNESSARKVFETGASQSKKLLDDSTMALLDSLFEYEDDSTSQDSSVAEPTGSGSDLDTYKG